MTQGHPVIMVEYCLCVIPLIKNLKVSHINITHPWYAENSGALGTFQNIENYFNDLT